MKLEPKGEIPPPICKAILLYERTMVEAGTAKISLLGLIRAHTLLGFPGRTSRMKMFLQLVGGIGDYDIKVEVHDLADDSVIFRARGPRISFPNRLDSLHLFFSIPGLPIAHPGRYDVIVLGNGAEIARQQFRAQLPKNGGVSQ